MNSKTKIVKFSELGSNCLLARRFIEGSRCERVYQCKYPEKKTCKAVDAELAHLHQKRRETVKGIHAKITQLIAERQL